MAEDMNATASNEVLRRKASVGRAAHELRAMTPAKALRLAIEKAADDGLKLAVSVTGCSRGATDPGEVLESVEDSGLIVSLDGPEGLKGALWLDFSCLTALIEAQTIGRIAVRSPEPRASTATDAAIVSPLLDDILTRFGANLATEEEGYWAQGYRFSGRCPDRRTLGLSLGEASYQLFRITLEVGSAGRTGAIMLALPLFAPPVPPVEIISPVQDFGPKLSTRMQDVPAQLDAVLCRLHLPLSELTDLAIGSVIPLAPGVLTATLLEAGRGVSIAKGQLGQINGQRALRLSLGGPQTSAPLPASREPEPEAQYSSVQSQAYEPSTSNALTEGDSRSENAPNQLLLSSELQALMQP
ncbi:MAG TPA: hypothetical protein DEF12_01645 [Rhodobacteraceae bacterium]|jgi:flagellar motor switch protein FliM|nr:hypothetical protein [Paracoccaceae bacterium]